MKVSRLMHAAIMLIKVNKMVIQLAQHLTLLLFPDMNKFSRLALLMLATIVAIAGFQGFWLWQNFSREKRAIESQAQLLFRESVFALQSARLNLDSLHVSGSVTDTVISDKVMAPIFPSRQVVNLVNTIGNVKKDSLQRGTKQVFITVDRSAVLSGKDTLNTTSTINFTQRNGNQIVRFLYGIDSLQDSIKVRDVDSAFKTVLSNQKLSIPFTIKRQNAAAPDFPPHLESNEVTIGFTRPVKYTLELGNLFPFLVKRLSSPILFSIFLVGFTILSFVLLYRNLMQQKRLTTLKSDFISNITHELKTPIATVTVAIEALKNFNALNDPRRTSEYLDISSNELQRLSLLVDKVLKLSMFENKAIALNKEWVDARAIVEQVMESMKPQFEKCNASVQLDTDDRDFIIRADKLHLTSVVYNLVDNALKYSPVNPVINIKLIHHGHYIDLIVEDNGIGISSEYKEKIFEKFFRVPNNDKHNIKGYGLGLSYVSHIARSHSGFIEVKSEPGKGSSFTVKLPVKEQKVIEYDKGRTVRRFEFKLGKNDG
jgi:two-component system phosphate regulon sensor histidine kinase PhoR